MLKFQWRISVTPMKIDRTSDYGLMFLNFIMPGAKIHSSKVLGEISVNGISLPYYEKIPDQYKAKIISREISIDYLKKQKILLLIGGEKRRVICVVKCCQEDLSYLNKNNIIRFQRRTINKKQT